MSNPLTSLLRIKESRFKELFGLVQAREWWERMRGTLVKKRLDGIKQPRFKELFGPVQAREWLERMRGKLVKKRPDGMAALILRSDGVGLVHLTFNKDKLHRPRLNVCHFQELSKGQSLARLAAGLVKARKLERARFVGVLDRNSYHLFPAEVPDVPREEWATAMRWRIKDQIDFPATQAVLEVFDMPPSRAAKDSERIYVAVAKDADVRRHVQLFLDAHLDLVAIDILELALRNVTIGLQDDQEGMALLHLEQKNGLIMMLKGGQFYLARRIDIGLNDLLESQKDQSPDDDDMFSAIYHSPLLDTIALEAQRTMDYFESHFGQAPAMSLHIAPLITPIPGFRQAMAERLGMRVKLLPLGEILEIPDTIDERNLALCLPAIGAAMRTKDLST
ncbi:MAG: hypothetical protein H7839_05825 [Magnetococcus sp. YQC-5]